MANELQTANEPSTTDLVRGAINDMGDLIRHELRFARTEFKADLRKSREAGLYMALGVIILTLGLVLFSLMLVFLLNWLSLPAELTAAGIPLWACFAIVSVVFLGAGAVLTWIGYQKFESFNPLPDETAQSVKENVEWIMNSK